MKIVSQLRCSIPPHKKYLQTKRQVEWSSEYFTEVDFHQKMDSIKYNAVLATAGTITGFSEEKLNQELGSESLQQRIENCYFFKQTTN